MVDLKGQYQKIKSEVDAGIQSVIESTAFINGPAVKEFPEPNLVESKVYPSLLKTPIHFSITSALAVALLFHPYYQYECVYHK